MISAGTLYAVQLTELAKKTVKITGGNLETSTIAHRRIQADG
jgi:hypothetical protein